MPAEVDGYRVLGVLGQGGMGIVYLAEQKEPRRRVALKVIRGSAHTDSLHVRLFRREAETLGRLRHPNIGAIYGAGRLPDGRPYFAMELVEGPTLSAYLASRPSPANRAELLHQLALAGRIAEAVNYAHQRGVIHRDLKPSNIVVPEATGGSSASFSSSGLPDVKVLDFGLARITDDESQVSMMSDVGEIRGTLPYMSPEQVRGETQTLDVRSDVYTLGVILSEMIAGERPYEVGSASLLHAMKIICEQEPKPLRDTPSGIAHVDGDLQAIVLKALAKEPERRYSSAAALAEDLERFRHSQPVLARTPSTAYQLRKLVARHKPIVAAAGLALLAIVVSAIVSTAMFVRARSEAAKARQVSAFLGEMLEGAGPSVARGRDTALLREILDRTAERVRTELKGQPEVAAGIEHVLGQTYLQIGDLIAAEEHARAAYETRRKLHRGRHPDVAADLSLLADTQWQRDRLPEADSLARMALEMWRGLEKGPHEGTANALTTLGGIQLDASRFESAEPLLRDGLAMSQQLHPNGDRTVAVALNSLGNLMHYTGRFDQADSLQRLALAMHRRMGGDLNPDVAADLFNMSQVEIDRGRFAAAESLAREGLSVCDRIYTEPHPSHAAGFLVLAGVYLRTGQFGRADSLARRSLELARSVRGGGEDAVGQALSALGVFSANAGHAEEALDYHRQALAVFQGSGVPKRSRLGTALDNVASALAGLGRFDEADSLYRLAIPLKLEAYGPQNPATLLTMNNYARMKIFVGDVAGAEALYRDVLAGRRAALGDSSDQVAVTLSDMGRCAIARGRSARAESLLTESTAIVEARLGTDAMNTNFVRSSLARVHRDLGKHAESVREFREARAYLGKIMGEEGPNLAWLDSELGASLDAAGESRAADSVFASLAKIPAAMLSPADLLRVRFYYGSYLAKRGRFAEAEKNLLLAEQALRDPRELNVRRRLDLLNTLVEMERTWSTRSPSPARTAALQRWTAVRDAEAPELKQAIEEGRAPRLGGAK
ncbi:MAG: serine/threonine protein kinase [Candidatus Eisenbacteria bacterium]|uniref:Serine/threonine protein kinase n=1 Tax=Eiseniibacteriota bacterium TaxID=2212470 RepID=A0A933W851_UNCEI|nr:serine/threonine protein kinase [Candidatus Eisenbacteria bacterium]